MEDIKRVISFDSVEEFWGYVQTVFGSWDSDLMMLQALQQYCAALDAAAEGKLLFIQGTALRYVKSASC